jgi:acyl carrier protein
VDKLALFNALVKVVRPAFSDYIPQTALQVKFPDTGLDSLDALMMTIYLSDIYGIPEEVAKQFSFSTLEELFVLLEKNATRTPVSVVDEVANLQ